ncbi:ISNCY family transposase [Candidatus Hydrogenedentota bacterium]
MRKIADHQLTLSFQPIKPRNSRKWHKISEILDANPEIADLVRRDLVTKKDGSQVNDTGADGMTGDQVLRFAIVKVCEGLSYRKLADRVEDSITLRGFCRVEFTKVPAFTTLNDNFKKLRPGTLKAINDIVMRYAKERKVEDGRQVRIDTTAVEANIHYPRDSRQLCDSIRVITRILKGIGTDHPELDFHFHDHTRSTKKFLYKISNARSIKKSKPLYRKLLKIARKTVGYGGQAVDTLRASGFEPEITEVLAKFCRLGQAVIEQTERRVLYGESVPAQEKVLSIFEPHTDVIVKGQREPTYGHKICFTGGKSNLILDCQIFSGNPADTDEFMPALERHEKLYGRAPLKVATDGGFTSKDNANHAKQIGVRDIAFSSLKGNKLIDLIKSERVYKKLRKWRAGIEGVISAAKRAYGLSRCNWSSFESFKAYVHLGVLAFNLTMLARLL